MRCCVEGCGREAVYTGKKLCQMHYFRLRRNGSTSLSKIAAAQRVITPNGYVRAYKKGHPLAICNRVLEHRAVVFDDIGQACCPCEICGKEESWSTCHVDHIDNNRQNNERRNLRVLCRGCNIKRGLSPESYKGRGKVGLIEFGGKRDTPAGWARDARVNVTGSTIIRRKSAGMSDFDALFSQKVTHKAAYAAKAKELARDEA